jgi:hypothetical protein
MASQPNSILHMLHQLDCGKTKAAFDCNSIVLFLLKRTIRMLIIQTGQQVYHTDLEFNYIAAHKLSVVWNHCDETTWKVTSTFSLDTNYIHW